jgi:hypothetical protein
MRTSCLLALLLLQVHSALAGDGSGPCVRSPELSYTRWRARLDNNARNVELESQRAFMNGSYLRLYGYRRLPAIPARMIEPAHPVSPPR